MAPRIDSGGGGSGSDDEEDEEPRKRRAVSDSESGSGGSTDGSSSPMSDEGFVSQSGDTRSDSSDGGGGGGDGTAGDSDTDLPPPDSRNSGNGFESRSGDTTTGQNGDDDPDGDPTPPEDPPDTPPQDSAPPEDSPTPPPENDSNDTRDTQTGGQSDTDSSATNNSGPPPTYTELSPADQQVARRFGENSEEFDRFDVADVNKQADGTYDITLTEQAREEQAVESFLAENPAYDKEDVSGAELQEDGTFSIQFTGEGESTFIGQNFEETATTQEAPSIAERLQNTQGEDATGVFDQGLEEGEGAIAEQAGKIENTVLEENPGLDETDVKIGLTENNEFEVTITEQGREDLRDQQQERADELLSGVTALEPDGAQDVSERAVQSSTPGNSDVGTTGTRQSRSRGRNPRTSESALSSQPTLGSETTATPPRTRQREERFGDIDFSAPTDALERATGVDVPFGGDPDADEVERFTDETIGEQGSEFVGRTIGDPLREFGENARQADVFADENVPGFARAVRESPLSDPDGTRVGELERNEPADIGPGEAIGNLAIATGNIAEDAPRVPGAALEAVEGAGFLLEGTTVAGGSEEEFDRRAEQAALFGAAAASRVAERARDNPGPFAGEALLGFGAGRVVSATRVGRATSNVADASAARRSVGRFTPDVGRARERVPDVEVTRDPNAGAVEIDDSLLSSPDVSRPDVSISDRVPDAPNVRDRVPSRADITERVPDAPSRSDVTETVTDVAGRPREAAVSVADTATDVVNRPRSAVADADPPDIRAAAQSARNRVRQEGVAARFRAAEGVNRVQDLPRDVQRRLIASQRRVGSGTSRVRDRARQELTNLRFRAAEGVERSVVTNPSAAVAGLRDRARSSIAGTSSTLGNARDRLRQEGTALRFAAAEQIRRPSGSSRSGVLPTGVRDLTVRVGDPDTGRNVAQSDAGTVPDEFLPGDRTIRDAGDGDDAGIFSSFDDSTDSVTDDGQEPFIDESFESDLSDAERARATGTRSDQPTGVQVQRRTPPETETPGETEFDSPQSPTVSIESVTGGIGGGVGGGEEPTGGSDVTDPTISPVGETPEDTVSGFPTGDTDTGVRQVDEVDTDTNTEADPTPDIYTARDFDTGIRSGGDTDTRVRTAVFAAEQADTATRDDTDQAIRAGSPSATRPRTGSDSEEDTEIEESGAERRFGGVAFGPDPLTPGWFEETATDIATGGQSGRITPSQDELEDQPAVARASGSLPTRQFLEGGETRDRVEAAQAFLSFGTVGEEPSDQEENDGEEFTLFDEDDGDTGLL